MGLKTHSLTDLNRRTFRLMLLLGLTTEAELSPRNGKQLPYVFIYIYPGKLGGVSRHKSVLNKGKREWV